jgi:anti-sigma-K factor RskA
MIPADPERREELAAEYVLGTLEAREAAEVARALETDAALAEAVARWEARLAPLNTLAAPEAPPPDLWARIEAALDPRAAAAGAPWWRRFADPWRIGAIGATAVAAGLALVMLARPAPQPMLMTVLLTDRDAPAWLVQADGEAIRLASLNTRPPPSDRVLELWALPQGATAPTSLGLIPSDGRITVRPTTIRPAPGMLIEITLEPPGGSPIGRPTGPIQFIGRLAPATGT